jgi:hypothetical protein
VAIRLDLFCEDVAHESCARAVVRRCAREERRAVNLRPASARSGIPRLKKELNAFQRVLRSSAGAPDLLIVMVDANDVGVAARRREVGEALDESLIPAFVIAVPDPCVERWLLADPTSFTGLLGAEPESGATNDRDAWRHRLLEALDRGGHIVTQGGSEFAEEIVEAMDLYRAGRAVPSLGAFVGDLRGALKRVASDD